MAEDVFIAGVGMHPFGRWPERSVRELSSQAIGAALADADLKVGDVEACFFANSLGGLLVGQESIRGEVCLHDAGISQIPIINVENACASGATALWGAIRAVRSGEFGIALAVGAEKMFVGDTKRTLAALLTASDIAATSGQGLQFVALYAMRLKEYLDAGILSMRHLAQVTVKNHRSGAMNPYALGRKPIAEQDVIAGRPVAGPLTLPMIAPITDGAAAAVVSSRPSNGSPTVRIRASLLRSGTVDGIGEPVNLACIGQAYEAAALGPEELSVAEVHDTVAPAELIRYVELGLCSRDGVGAFFDSGATQLSGSIPVNPSGGLTARGHPVAATGLAQVFDLVMQLRSEAGERQVPDCRIGLAQNSGGWLDGDTAVCSVHILERLGS